ncbi:MAG TPA: diheme cytochrome c [Burkholderiaceae bacterium]|nr:diheme cytochrome c [Burkholderiaceae bacterium]
MVMSHAVARADGGRIGQGPVLPAYGQECAACHIAYPPALLPAASWLRVMRSLSDHHGVDASLDAATSAQVSAWLVANAATSGRRLEEPPADRITRAAWFARKHHEVPPAAWQRQAVRSPANCAACHTQADQGDFDEHRVRIPR